MFDLQLQDKLILVNISKLGHRQDILVPCRPPRSVQFATHFCSTLELFFIVVIAFVRSQIFLLYHSRRMVHFFCDLCSPADVLATDYTVLHCSDLSMHISQTYLIEKSDRL